jgi:hypothetical protein
LCIVPSLNDRAYTSHYRGVPSVHHPPNPLLPIVSESTEIGDLDGLATSLVRLAQLNALEGRFEEAVAQSWEAVRLLEGLGSFKAARARENLRAIEAMAARGPGA